MGWSRNVFIAVVVLIMGTLTSCHNSDEVCAASSLVISVEEILSLGCDGKAGKISVVVTGGTGDLKYSMNDSVFQDNGIFESMRKGIYRMSVSDAIGCHSEVLAILRSSDLSIEIKNLTHVKCGVGFGKFDAKGFGGAGSFQYKIGQGEFQSNGSFTGLTAGIYTLAMMDKMGCMFNETVEIEDQKGVNIDQIVSAHVSNCMQSEGSLTVEVSGGDGNYQFKIDEGQSQTQNEFSGLTSGEYLITVQDGKGCIASEVAAVGEREGVSLKKIISLFPACDSLSAKLLVQAQGGTGAYEYKLGSGTYQFFNEFENLKTGSYEVFVRDDMGCTISKEHEIQYAVSFTDIKELFTANCTFEPCHNGNNNLINLTEIDGIRKYESQIVRKVTFGNEISKNGKLSEDEVNQIVCWLKKGAMGS